MSIVDLDKLTPKGLVAQFIVETRGGSQVLAYLDYEVIDEWLSVAPSVDDLLIVLAEELPPFFSRKAERKSVSIRGLRRKVLRNLAESAIRRQGVRTS